MIKKNLSITASGYDVFLVQDVETLALACGIQWGLLQASGLHLSTLLHTSCTFCTQSK